jgi:hypothetical protein
MAEGPIINVLCEGDEDRALATALVRDAAFAGGLKVEKLPESDRRRLPDGMEGLADRAARYVPTARGELGGRVVVLRDVQYTSDDYVLRALLDPAVYAAAQRAERDNEFRRIEGAVALHKLRRVIEVLRDAADGGAIPVEQSKRVTQIFRGLTDFRASNATFTERILKAVSSHPAEDARTALWRPLRDDLFDAVQRLRA